MSIHSKFNYYCTGTILPILIINWDTSRNDPTTTGNEALHFTNASRVSKLYTPGGDSVNYTNTGWKKYYCTSLSFSSDKCCGVGTSSNWTDYLKSVAEGVPGQIINGIAAAISGGYLYDSFVTWDPTDSISGIKSVSTAKDETEMEYLVDGSQPYPQTWRQWMSVPIDDPGQGANPLPSFKGRNDQQVQLVGGYLKAFNNTLAGKPNTSVYKYFSYPDISNGIIFPYYSEPTLNGFKCENQEDNFNPISDKCTFSCDFGYLSGSVDISSTTVFTINNQNSFSYVWAPDLITYYQPSDLSYNFTTFSIQSAYQAKQYNIWNTPQYSWLIVPGQSVNQLQNSNNGGWQLYTSVYSSTTDPFQFELPTPFINSITSDQSISTSTSQQTYDFDGTVCARYYYRNSQDHSTDYQMDISNGTFFHLYPTAMGHLSAYLLAVHTASTITIGINSSIDLSGMYGFSFFLTSTILHIFMDLFYWQIYNYYSSDQSTVTTAFTNVFRTSQYDILSVYQENDFTTYITSQYDQYITSAIKGTPHKKDYITVPYATLSSFFHYPQVYYVNDVDTGVYMKCTFPYHVLHKLIELDFSDQESLLNTYMNNFFNESLDTYTQGLQTSSISVHPATFTLQPYDSSYQFVKGMNISNYITLLGNSTSTVATSVLSSVQVHLIDLQSSKPLVYQHGNLYDNTNTLLTGTYASTILNQLQKPFIYHDMSSNIVNLVSPQPYVVCASFTLLVKNWSPILTAYVLKGLQTVPSSSIVLSTVPNTIPLENIYKHMTVTSGWCPLPLFNVIKTYGATVTKDAMSSFCNTYYRQSGTPYTTLSQWLVSRFNYDGTSTDCSCVFSLLGPAGTSAPNVASMCYDKACSTLDPAVLKAFNITTTTCSNPDTCALVNEWMTSIDPFNKSLHKQAFNNDAFVTNCGSLYSSENYSPIATILQPTSFNKTVLWMGVICIFILICFIYIGIRSMSFSKMTAILLCSLFTMVAFLMLYYVSSMVKGRWTCTPPQTITDASSNIVQIISPQAVCTSNVNNNWKLPEEWCTDTKPCCECRSDKDCELLGSIPQNTSPDGINIDSSGFCIGSTIDSSGGDIIVPIIDLSGNPIPILMKPGQSCLKGYCNAGTCLLHSNTPRPTYTTYSKKRVPYTYLIFLVFLAISLPLLYHGFIKYNHVTIHESITVGIVLVLFLLPLFFLYKQSTHYEYITNFT